MESKYILAIMSGLVLTVGMTAIGVGMTAAVAFGFALYLALETLS